MRSDLPPWRSILHDGYAETYAQRVQAFFDEVIQPVAGDLANRLSSTERGPDDEAIAKWDALRESQLDLHRSLALALGGMWERQFRAHLFSSVAVIGPKARVGDIERANSSRWPKLFKDCRGFELSKLPGYAEIELLLLVSNVVRHGNGESSRKLYERRPDWFSHNPITDFFAYFTLGGEPADSIERLEITLVQLRVFTDAIAAFWQCIADLRSGAA